MNLLCKLGFHKLDPYRFAIVRKQNGRHRWNRNYGICRRCGRLKYLVSFSRMKEGEV